MSRHTRAVGSLLTNPVGTPTGGNTASSGSPARLTSVPGVAASGGRIAAIVYVVVAGRVPPDATTRAAIDASVMAVGRAGRECRESQSWLCSPACAI